MAESVYNERFVFPDPYDRQAINRTTRYRLKKKREGTLYTDDSMAPKQKKPESAAATAVLNCDDPFVEDALEVDVQDDCEQLEREHSLCHFGTSEDSDNMVKDRVNLSDEESDTECEGVGDNERVHTRASGSPLSRFMPYHCSKSHSSDEIQNEAQHHSGRFKGSATSH